MVSSIIEASITTLTYLTSEYDRANPFTTKYVTSFLADGAESEDYQLVLRVTQQILRLALFEHALIHRMTLSRSKQPNYATTASTLETCHLLICSCPVLQPAFQW